MRALPELSGPLLDTSWGLPDWLEKPGIGGQIWGPAPPDRKFPFFWPDQLPMYFGPLFLLHSGSVRRGSTCLKWKKFPFQNKPPKMGFKNFGGVALFGFCPSEPRYFGHTPNLTSASYRPGEPEKKKFSFWGIAPILGDMWGSKNVNFAPNFLKILSSDFWITQQITSMSCPLFNEKFKKNSDPCNSFNSRSNF